MTYGSADAQALADRELRGAVRERQDDACRRAVGRTQEERRPRGAVEPLLLHGPPSEALPQVELQHHSCPAGGGLHADPHEISLPAARHTDRHLVIEDGHTDCRARHLAADGPIGGRRPRGDVRGERAVVSDRRRRHRSESRPRIGLDGHLRADRKRGPTGQRQGVIRRGERRDGPEQDVGDVDLAGHVPMNCAVVVEGPSGAETVTERLVEGERPGRELIGRARHRVAAAGVMPADRVAGEDRDLGRAQTHRRKSLH